MHQCIQEITFSLEKLIRAAELLQAVTDLAKALAYLESVICVFEQG